MNQYPESVSTTGSAARRGVRTGRLYAFACLAFLALFATRAQAAVHPVPLDKNVDSAKCLECHEDKTKGKSVHSAMGRAA